jgi:3-isopropylmalate dehydratase small subunit
MDCTGWPYRLSHREEPPEACGLRDYANPRFQPRAAAGVAARIPPPSASAARPAQGQWSPRPPSLVPRTLALRRARCWTTATAASACDLPSAGGPEPWRSGRPGSRACDRRLQPDGENGVTLAGCWPAPGAHRAGRYRRTMAASIGGSGVCTGRAVSVRHEDEVTELPGRVGATILIASPGCWSSSERTIAMITACGFQVVISPGLGHIISNNLIKAAILSVVLPVKTVTKLQDTVESDPGIMLTVDAGRGELRAGGALIARFEIAPARSADEANSRASGGEAMARRLLMAQRLLGSASLSGEVRMRFQRRLVAICDAMKAPGADAGRGARRLDRLLIELAGQPGLTQARDGRAPGRPRDLGRRSGLDGGRRAP